MLPLYLSIEGLYSYQTKQEIDFTTLTAAGLFGIFGKVGSGKSSILEAITFALFANTNRLNSNNRAYNMMNLNANQLRIEFHFIGKENKKYAFEASWRRNSKQFDKVTTPIRKAYVFEGEEKIPLESTDAESILGISYKNFNRTVIVPQGQFKEFLELKGAERSGMMKELFNLDHYDLFYKVASLNKETEMKLQNILGAIQTLEDYTEQSIIILQTQQEKEESDLLAVTQKHQLLEQHHQKLLEVQQLYREIDRKKERFNQLSAEHIHIENLKTQIQLFKKIERVFKHPLDILTGELAEEVKLKEDANTAQVQLERVHAALLDATKQFRLVEDSFNLLDDKKIEVEDLKNIVHVLQLQVDISIDNERLAKGKLVLDDVEKQILNKQVLIQEKQHEISSLKEKRISGSLLVAINDWYTKQELFLKNQGELQADVVAKQKEFQAILLQFEHKNLDPSNWKEQIVNLESELSKRLEQIQDDQNKAQVQQQLASYSHALKAGEACLLCGSTDHPHIMQTKDVSALLTSLQSEKAKILAEIVENQDQKQEFFQLAANLSNLEKDLDTQVVKLEKVAQNLRDHFKTFTWSTFQPYDRQAFDHWQREALTIEQKCTAAEMSLSTLQNELDELKTKKEKYNLGLNNIAVSKSAIEGRATSYQQLIKRLNLSDFKHVPLSDIENTIAQSLQSIIATEQDFKRLSEDINQLHIAIATYSTTTANLQLQLNTTRLKIESQQKAIADLLDVHGFEATQDVQQILQQQYDLEKEESKIRQFEEQFAIIKTALLQLEEKVKEHAIDVSQLDIVSQELQLTKDIKDKAIGQLQSLKDQIIISKKKYAEKLQLQNECDQLILRNKNLNVLSNLFKGNGFVDYISTQYLEDLCQIANQRFERLTRGHLKLMINTDNDFEVIDHLNGGKSRSVRTLSGGQFFQASLCLALALAESTRSLNQNEKNFFFIDEGFGTQDTESVNLIFETLNSLHKENRIVGIISHVDELQERIPASIRIVKDEERGSLVVNTF